GLPAEPLDGPRIGPGTVPRRPLEHHVLEEVGEARAAERLVPRPDPVPDLEGDDRAPVVLLQEDAEAVVEARLDDLPRSGRTRGPQAHADEPGAEKPEERASAAHRLSIQGHPARSRSLTARARARGEGQR